MADTRRIVVKDTGDGQASGPGGFVNTGVIDGNITIPPIRPAVSGYLHQVRRLAAPRFQGRQQELLAMADFCMQEESDHAEQTSWWRWLAPAWAGKTALMTEFVLNHPPEVAVVSFFITARLAGQNTRTAFCEVVQRQLYALLEEEEPPVTEHTRDELLLYALERAANKCAADGKRLILLVDGLDEDRSSDTEPGGHSIAALLPAEPPNGTRIMVAGRPHPPIPRDVPPEHPLRSGTINRRLDRSMHAATIRVEAENSLDELVEGGGLPLELLGLVAAAGGGLSVTDLADLARERPLRVRRALEGTVGRIFLTTPAIWSTNAGSDVYLLGHEEIQKAALEALGDSEISAYRARICVWADSYQERAWPEETPEYLLRGYPQLLRSGGEFERLSHLARDTNRHELLWRRTGSDLDALSEISTALDIHRAQAEIGFPDVGKSLMLAMSRDTLHEHNNNLPTPIVIAWAILGETDRAVNLALAHPDTTHRIHALISVGISLLEAGELHGAVVFAALSAEAAQSADDLEMRSIALARYAAVLARLGEFDKSNSLVREALAAAREISQMPDRVRAISCVASLFSSDHECLEALSGVAEEARSVDESVAQAKILIEVARAMVKNGQSQEAFRTASDAGEITHSVVIADQRVSLFCQISGLMAALGREDLASQAIAYAGRASFEIHTVERRSRAQLEISTMLSSIGQHQKALGVAEKMVEGESRSRALACIAGDLARAGDYGRAETIVRTVADPNQRAQGLAEVAAVAARADRLLHAVNLAHAVMVPSWRAQALAEIAVVLARMGQRADAERMAIEAAETVRNTIEPMKLFRVMADVAGAMVDSDHCDQAVQIVNQAVELARTVTESSWLARALSQSASILARAGNQAHAVLLATEAVEIASGGADNRARALHEAAVALARAGQHESALEVAKGIQDPGWKPIALGEIAHEIALFGEFDDAFGLAGSIADHGWRARTLARVVGARAKNEGISDSVALDLEKAMQAASAVRDPGLRARVLSEIAETMAFAGAYSLANRVSYEAVETVRIISDIGSRAECLAKVACALASAGEHAQAMQIAAEAAGAASSVKIPVKRSYVFAQSALAMARAGFREEAQDVAAHIKEPRRHGRALVKVAAECGSSISGQRVLIEALQLIPWEYTCEALAQVAPSSLCIVARRLLNECD
ncbi:hypothetical protein [Streptomyces sp. NBC_00140]|uniref:hypothetical protein n=1 Tax=Streptomyces sp. NBC_00140 TaxID=2975664 RepID=UPI002252159E|nr:hypothetical protein [Streptomyces sp. NBC_00140]MCX5332118.1 hypothetical protein [Streptomyces sp. NBC_00140]